MCVGVWACFRELCHRELVVLPTEDDDAELLCTSSLALPLPLSLPSPFLTVGANSALPLILWEA